MSAMKASLTALIQFYVANSFLPQNAINKGRLRVRVIQQTVAINMSTRYVCHYKSECLLFWQVLDTSFVVKREAMFFRHVHLVWRIV